MSAVVRPMAPSSIARRTSARIRSSSPAVGGRLSRPTSFARTVAALTNDATLVDTPRAASGVQILPPVCSKICRT